MATFFEATSQKNKLSKLVLSHSEVHGIGVGYANPRKPSQGAGTIVYVERNISSKRLATLKATMERTVGTASNVPIRFIKSGGFYTDKLVAAQPIYQTRLRPVPGGVSVGTATAGTGTAGVITVNYPNPSRLYVLSNAHVLNPTNDTSFHEVIQPGRSDGGQPGTDRIGRTYQSVIISTTSVNYLDASIAIADQNSLLDPRYLLGNTGQRIVLSGHFVSYPVGLRLRKTGRTSGYGTGTVESINATTRIQYPFGIGTFENQTIVQGDGVVGGPGDSGSVWIGRGFNGSDYAAAVHYSSTSNMTRSLCFPIQYAMQTFGLRIAIPATSSARPEAGSLKVAPRKSFAYTQPLTQRELEQINVVRAKRR
ncbi:hypothetical protein EDC32_102535 [Laceyella sacchari]|jgi:hypothetical protein|uniref:hypothetical protein n=1 Tax=Laceyella sacchari TaxID=37482 RepID=UPI0010504D70|nr:hypothetical protein [Laceyella sacchari]TCW39288.1 hypothetical protein EDC32_102535 [Laceyella sacchari]